MTVCEPDQVGRFAVRAAHFDDLTDAVGHVDLIAVHVQLVPNSSLHHHHLRIPSVSGSPGMRIGGTPGGARKGYCSSRQASETFSTLFMCSPSHSSSFSAVISPEATCSTEARTSSRALLVSGSEVLAIRSSSSWILVSASRLACSGFSKLGANPVAVLTASKQAVAAFRSSTASWNSSVVSCAVVSVRSEEHTSELQSRENLVCRLLLEKKNVSDER